MTVEYLTIQPARVETPVVTYAGRSGFHYENGRGQILDDHHRVLVEATGTLEHVAAQAWELRDGPIVWRVERGKGCNCGG